MGKAAKLEFVRRLVPLSLCVLSIVGGYFFMSVLSSMLCVAVAAGIYAALPRPVFPSGAVGPIAKPSVTVLDIIGFVLGITFFSAALIGLGLATGGLALAALFALVPAFASLIFFAIAVRQETSWVRFFGNGFEFMQFALRTRVPYEDLKKVEVRIWQASGWAAWFQATVGSVGRRSAVLLNGAQNTKALVFQRNDGAKFTVSSELIPDIQRILIGMDRAGSELPEGISEWQRNKIRSRRERMYGAPPKPEPESEQLNVARIAALIEHARRRPG